MFLFREVSDVDNLLSGRIDRKLDRKSSRGMIYENEELRLRTININAEVERGQSDIRKLRRENEQLRREIWSMRDEYDRLYKLLRSNRKSDSCENVGNGSGSQTEDSNSCETCKEEDNCDDIDEQECFDGDDDRGRLENSRNMESQIAKNVNKQEIEENYENAQKTLGDNFNNSVSEQPSSSNKLRENLHVNFDHLSIVSEENLTNSDASSNQLGDFSAATANVDVSQGELKRIDSTYQSTSSGEPPISPCLHDLQSVVPSLAYFENIEYDKIGPSLDSLEEPANSTSTTATAETVIPSSGWDFNIQSPFSLNKMLTGYDTNVGTSQSLKPQQVTPSTSSTSNVIHKTNETEQQKSPKHFFSPIKRRAVLDKTALPMNTLPKSNCPDVFVANALASPSNRLAHETARDELYSTIQKCPTGNGVPSSFQTGGNLEDLLMDIETLSKDILHMQLEKQKSYSQERLGTSETLASKKPYRSEINLVLTYNGSNPVIAPIVKATSTSSGTGFNLNNNYYDDTYDPQPPRLPEPMILFPQNLTYLGFENFGQPSAGGGCGGGLPIISQSPSDQFPDECTLDVGENVLISSPTILYDSTRNINELTDSPLTKKKAVKKQPPDVSLRPNVPSTADAKSLPIVQNIPENANNCESSSGSETTKPKSRRVSIAQNNTGDKEVTQKSDSNSKTKEMTVANVNKDSSGGGNLSESEQAYTPSQRKSSSSITNQTHSPGTRSTNVSHHHDHQHHHSRKKSQDSTKASRASRSGSILDGAVDNHRKSKCTRRHSETTMLSPTGGPSLDNRLLKNNDIRIPGSGYVPGRNETSNSFKALGMIRDSFREPGASVSERNSISLESSRESSMSLSMPSERRKISVSSHSGGKIPWCGCWGNGCL